MVCHHDDLPLIRLGGYDIGDYDTSWISVEVRAAAMRTGSADALYSSEVAESVLGYLRHYCPRNVVDLELVAGQVCCCLRAIGHPEVAEALDLKAPPVYVHLGEIASRSAGSIELGFFQLFRSRLAGLLGPRVRSLKLGGLDAALDTLTDGLDEGARETMRDEIVQLAREMAIDLADGGDVRLTVEG